MGRKARNRQRTFDMHKQPNEPKRAFVARKVGELNDMDTAVREAFKGTHSSLTALDEIEGTE